MTPTALIDTALAAALVERNPLPLVVVDEQDGRILLANPRAEELGFQVGVRVTPWPPEREHGLARRASDELLHPVAARLGPEDGPSVTVDLVERAIEVDGRAARLIILISAMARRSRAARLAEAQRQSDRLEAVGRLAGGVAHDLNNLLTVMRGHADLLAIQLPEASEAQDDVTRIREAADRASDLARRLVAFARGQVLHPEVLDLHASIERLRPVLESLLTANHSLVLGLDPRPLHVHVDSSQLDQVVLNLALNARDAMVEGGVLLIETAAVEIDAAFAALEPGLEPGPYVVLAVSDTGVGVSPEAREHLFEPFFTTKAAGRGNGLGLATVYGIVHQSGGSISVWSDPGMGTTFRVYLPRATTPVAEAPVTTRPEPAAPTSGTALVVDDEPDVRRLLATVLERAGYRVVTAPNGEAALAALRTAGPVDILVTDLVMPGMGGRALAERLLGEHPGLPVLFVSGFDDGQTLDGLPAGTAFLGKPFRAEALLAEVGRLLGQRALAGAGDPDPGDL